jgi:ribosomal protein S18 acetylase RimI-like enzyme
MHLRHAEPDDYYFINSVINDWWGGRQLRDLLPKLFFIHFRDTSFIIEQNGEIIGFLNGFFSQTYPDQAYIHFVGVHPNHRHAGVARLLYEKFFEVARVAGRTTVQCITSPINKNSIAFHRRMGFEIEPGDGQEDGISVHTNYDGKGESRVLFIKRL